MQYKKETIYEVVVDKSRLTNVYADGTEYKTTVEYLRHGDHIEFIGNYPDPRDNMLSDEVLPKFKFNEFVGFLRSKEECPVKELGNRTECIEDSLHEIWRMQRDLNEKIGRDTVFSSNKEAWVFDYITALEQEVSELKDCTNWKFWSVEYKKHDKHAIIDKQNAKVEMVDILHFVVSLAQCLGFTPESLLDVYKQKWQVNMNRQDNGYNHLNKTEEDNKSIKC